MATAFMIAWVCNLGVAAPRSALALLHGVQRLRRDKVDDPSRLIWSLQCDRFSMRTLQMGVALYICG